MLLGAVLTLLVIALDAVGTLAPLERFLYDLRARQCQFFSPAPTDELVYIDIDDQSLLAMDAFPWPRNTFPAIVDEIRRAGAKTLAFDVLFTERQRDAEQTDEKLARACREFGRVLVPASFDVNLPGTSKAFEQVRDALVGDLELTPEEVGTRTKLSLAQVHREFPEAIREAFFRRIQDEARGMTTRPTAASLREKLLPKTSASVRNSYLLRLLSNQLERVESQQRFGRFARASKVDDVQFLRAHGVLAPISVLGDAAAGTGYVDYLPTSDGVVRTMPLFVRYGEGVYPQAGLALACAALGTDPRDPEQVQIGRDEVTLHVRDGREIRIPVHAVHSSRLDATADCFIDIPWYGGSDWAEMYARFEKNPHLLIGDIWQLAQSRKAVVDNNAAADDAIKQLLKTLDETRLRQYASHPPPPEDVAERVKLIDSLLKELKDAGWLEAYAGKKPEDFPDEANRLTLSAIRAVEEIQRTAPALADTIAKQEAYLRSRLAGKAALLGYVATAAASSDFVPTPLHARCPGVIIHGAIFNGIMTGELWRPIPRWVDVLITLAVGLLASWIIALLSPWKALAATAALLAGYLAINGIVLFDYFNLSTNGAGANGLAASFVVFVGCVLVRLLVEGIERARITRRFRAYNDPSLVDYILEHPEAEQQLTTGQLRTVTVAFTDIAGFTSITERLGADSVRIINEYLEVMVPIIRRHRGYVNKFMGDGIMFFFNAPLPNPDHASDAVACVLEMQAALPGFNEKLVARGLPTIGMRAGVSTGELIVGDAGSSDRSDYTAMGDSTNLASRLESANKTTGTSNLVTAATAALLKDEFLLRPVGRLQVVGKAQAIETYEVLCRRSECTAEQERLVEKTGLMVRAFQCSDFVRCAQIAADIEAELSAGKLTTLYRTLARLHETTPAAEPFEGKIVLAEK
jgi:class 3 adenylate cyclase/CHASE2 domain-containing sensor protein